MSNQPFITWPFKPTGATTARTEPNRLADIINVKDYGATGDGVTDDTASIQSAFNAAFGSSANPNGSSASYLNKTVFFPAGQYRITGNGLTLTDVYGGHITGSGMNATQLTMTATIPSMIGIDGMANSLIENMAIGNAGKSSNSGSICIDMNWTGTSTGVGLSNNTLFKILFGNANYGVRVGRSGNGGGEISLNQCLISTIYYGLTIESSAADVTELGGGIIECFYGVWVQKGFGFSFLGGNFAGTTQQDIQLDNDATVSVFGSRSEARDHVAISSGGTYTGNGLQHASAAAGFSANLSGSAAVATFTNCLLGSGTAGTGFITGTNANAALYLRATEFVNNPPIFVSSFSGKIMQWVGPTFTFSQLPSSNNAGEGVQFNLTDGNSTTWGAQVTASSNKHVLVRWNSTGWTVVGN